MKFKLDENLPVSSAAILASGGHDVDTVTDLGLAGAPDRDLVAGLDRSAVRLVDEILPLVSVISAVAEQFGLEQRTTAAAYAARTFTTARPDRAGP